MVLKEQQIYYMVGFPKAGSTLMRNLIKGHPQVNYLYDDNITRLITGDAPLVEYDEAESKSKYLEMLSKRLTGQCNVIADETVWAHVKREIGRKTVNSLEEMRSHALSALRRLQKTPRLIKSFFDQPECQYARI